MLFNRRMLLVVGPTAALAVLAACSDSANSGPSAGDGSKPDDPGAGGWRMPAEETPHERTWMCWPSSSAVWGNDLAAVQAAIARIARAIASFEPVTMIVRAEEATAVAALLGDDVDTLEGPVDDLWARDTLPNFLVRRGASGATELAASHATFNGWGDKQIHAGDARLAAVVAEHLGIELFESGLVGEGGAIEVDGQGTVLAAESCWVNRNRNPGLGRDDVERALLRMLGAERMIWVDGLAGADITDGHIDTLARFANAAIIVIDRPAVDDPDDPWVAVAQRTAELISATRSSAGEPYDVVEVVQPSTTRREGDDFLATYMNYYVCNGAVIAPEFGDEAGDAAAREVLASLFPGREIVLLDIDALAAGGGGIHCATQQQPRIS